MNLGQAYWVRMNAPKSDWIIHGTLPEPAQAVSFFLGWNFTGVPAEMAATDIGEVVLMLLMNTEFEFDLVLCWENNQYLKFTPENGDNDDFTVVNKNKAYWVRTRPKSTPKVSISTEFIRRA